MSTSPSAYAEFAGSKKRAKIRQIKTRDAVLWGASQKTKKIVRLVLGQLQELAWLLLTDLGAAVPEGDAGQIDVLTAYTVTDIASMLGLPRLASEQIIRDCAQQLDLSCPQSFLYFCMAHYRSDRKKMHRQP